MQAPLLNAARDRRPDRFPVDPALKSSSRAAAILYGLLAVYYAAVTTVFLVRMPWTSVEQFSEDLISRPEAIMVLLGFIAANVMLAACAWNVVSISRTASWLVALVALGATIWFWGI